MVMLFFARLFNSKILKRNISFPVVLCTEYVLLFILLSKKQVYFNSTRNEHLQIKILIETKMSDGF